MQESIDVIADRLAQMMDSWQSIELKERRDILNHDSGTKTTPRDHYIETALGQRRSEFIAPPTEDAQATSHIHYADGRRFAKEVIRDGKQFQVEFKRAFSNEDKAGRSDRGITFHYLYLDHKPLHQAVRDAKHLGESQRLGRECEVLLLTGKKLAFRPVDLVYELDREAGFPLAIQGYASEADRLAGRPQFTWTATSFDRVGEGRFWPMKSVSVTFKPAQDGEPQALLTSTITVESLEFDKSYPESLFWPTLRPGVTVWDRIEGKHWVVPGEDVAPAETSPQTLSVPAVPPRPWTATASTAGLWLGVVLLGIGGVMWWRRR